MNFGYLSWTGAGIELSFVCGTYESKYLNCSIIVILQRLSLQLINRHYLYIYLFYLLFIWFIYLYRLRWSRGSVLAFGTQVRGFKPGRSRRIFKGEKILSTPS